MLKVTDKDGKTHEIPNNPWIPQYRNLTHRMLLRVYMPDMAKKLEQQAYKLTPEYQQEQRRLEYDRWLNESKAQS
jgi:hypothetical protein